MLKKETATTSKIAKEGKTHKNLSEWKDSKMTTTDKSDNTTGRNKSKIQAKKEDSKSFGKELWNTNKTAPSK